MSASILNILNELATSLGREAVVEACMNFSSPDAVQTKKVKKERKARGPSSWNVEVQKVLEELRTVATSPEEGAKITHKMAMEEASRRRRTDDPEAQAKYEANRAKVEAKRASKTSTTDTPVVVVAKSAGRPKK